MKIILIVILTYALTFCFTQTGSCGTGIAADYLCELGVVYYQRGDIEDALIEFNKALIINPDNRVALEYVNHIFQRDWESRNRVESIEEEVPILPKQEANNLEVLQEVKKEEVSPSNPLKITGEAQLSLGITSEDTIWKQANAALNEKDSRVLSDKGFNRKENSYDKAIYDKLRINLDTENPEGLSFHSNLTVDPWSFVGKSDKVTIISSWGIPAEIELKYWSNTGYTANEIGRTFTDGDTFIIPEIKVKDGKTTPVNINTYWSGDFDIPELKINREFQPLRELWFDYKQDGLNFRLFPIAYQDQAFTSDDPLKLTNNRSWYENSLWLRRWQPGLYNSGPADFTKGSWDNSLSFLARDSSGTWLTSLRGFSLDLKPWQDSSFFWTVATPKHLWQDYEEVDNIINVARLKTKLFDSLSIGTTYTMRMGLNIDEGSATDTLNHVGAMDLRYEVMDGVMASLEIAHSQSDYDLTSSQFKTESRGNAYYFSTMARYPAKSIMDLENGYDGIKADEEEPFLAKARLFLARMDQGFNSALSSYRQTRRDAYWSRHLHFRSAFEYYYGGLYYPSLKWEDIQPFSIGNGIDIGRDALGLRIETIWTDKVNNLFDLRSVRETSGSYIETVGREEITYKVNPKLTLKGLWIYQNLPKTKAGIDPFIYDNKTGLYLYDYSADPIEGGKDPSLQTSSLGLKYAFFDWLSVNGIWEYTNDYTLAYDNFPRGDLNSAEPSLVYDEYGRSYRRDRVFLYGQHLFPQPPYPYYNIVKAGIDLMPIEKLNLYLDYTRNEFESAGQIDDNMNHFGIEAAYLPTPKLGFYLKYTYSRWKDLDKLIQGITKTFGHHNFFGELRYLRTEDDELVLQYGQGGVNPVSTIAFDPFGGSLSTIDTQHIFRAYYRRKF